MTPTSSDSPLATAALSTDASSSAPIHTISAGLVQISGIASLIGGNGLSEQSLGLKAAPGFAWSSMSCFGILKAVRAFVAGAIGNDTWREILGLRAEAVDDALGFGFWTEVDKPVAGGTVKSSVRSAMQQRGLKLAEERTGIWLKVPSGLDRGIHAKTPKDQFLDDKLAGWNSLVAHDRLLKNTLAVTSAFNDEKSIQVHGFIPDNTAHDYQLVDWVLIAASAVKVIEAIILYRMGSNYLWWSSMIGFTCCILFAILLQSLNLGRDTHRNISSTADYLIGTLPSYKRIGSAERKIILGQPLTVRRNPLWRAVWAISAITNITSVGITFYVLAKELEESANLVYVWIGFQILWALLRTFVYHIVPISAGALNVNLTTQPLESMPPSAQARVLRLLLAASLLQTHEHVRIYEAYLEDIQSVSSPEQLISFSRSTNWQTADALPSLPQQTFQAITIEGIIGEHILRTFTWITNSKIDNAEIYDSVLVLFRLAPEERLLVPGVRVMAGRLIKPVPHDPEAITPSFDMRGTVNREKTGYWVYWFPVGKDMWLEIRCNPFSLLGGLSGFRVLTGRELDRELGAGTLSIGLRSLRDLETALDVSRGCSELLVRTVKGLRVSEEKS